MPLLHRIYNKLLEENHLTGIDKKLDSYNKKRRKEKQQP